MTSQKDLILIVDDVPTNIKILLELLHQSGFQVAIAKNGRSALEKVRETLPDLILLDVMMPEMDGFETCCRLKDATLTKAVPVIFMTARSDVVDKVKGLSLGAVDYITKPFQTEEVLARIQVHLELRRTQLRLAEETKMAALGQLVAGIAHEINNPISFIYGNLSHARKYYQDLIELVALYDTEVLAPTPELQNFIEQIDLEFLKHDLPKLIDSMQEGAERISEIVRSLRIFSRLDEAERKLVNIHECIDSTLMLLNHRLQNHLESSGYPEITIIKHYGELPQTECCPGHLNQVFMNVLTNAIEALEKKAIENAAIESENWSDHQSIFTISICTEVCLDKPAIKIHIADTGVGISAEDRRNIFDRFFTTKPVGKGTGLGLSVCRQIVEEIHAGSLTCFSELGKGTEIIIEIGV